MAKFDIPVVLFIFKREKKTLEIIKRISQITPQKIYLIADGGRNDDEHKQALNCRTKIEDAINWDCTIIKNYATNNRGVYGNIALGAKWVFEQEEFAIFLEDDNLPELSFFNFCKEMLIKYKDNKRIFYICGTNYLGKYNPINGSDYVFTQHMLPCGWASWSDKFLTYYDGELELFNDENIKSIKQLYYNNKLYNYDIKRIRSECERKKKGERFLSWDYQLIFSLRVHDLYGVVPKYNQIKNIGADADSIHGGNSLYNTMTKRFCEIETYSIELPIKHPQEIKLDILFEKKITKIVMPPSSVVVKILIKIVRKVFLIPNEMPIMEAFYRLRNGNKNW